MYFIVVKYQVKPEFVDGFIERTRAFTEATRAEPGNKFFEWSRSVDDQNRYLLIEAFDDDAAGAHVTSAHFQQAQADLPQYVQETPEIRNIQGQPEEWDRLGEFEVN